MESLVEWYANNGAALWTTIISFFSAYGVALLSLIVGIIKTRINAIAQNKVSDEKLTELTNSFIKRLEELESSVIEVSNVNTEKRLEAMKNISKAVEEANKALQPIESEEVIEDNNDANKALENLE